MHFIVAYFDVFVTVSEHVRHAELKDYLLTYLCYI